MTLFPGMFSGPFSESIIKRAIEKKLVEIELINLRDFGEGSRKTVDDRPYGGGVGMVMRVDIVEQAIEYVKCHCEEPRREAGRRSNLTFKRGLLPHSLRSGSTSSARNDSKTKVILLDPAGKVFNQKKARQFSKLDHLILVCGHYEGIDARIEKFSDEVISIGDYILTGGEIPGMVVVDSVVRLLPGVLVKPEAVKNESFSKLASKGEALRGYDNLIFSYPPYLYILTLRLSRC